MTPAVLVCNAGSSSLRCAVYASASLDPLCRVHVESVGTSRQTVAWNGPQGVLLNALLPPADADHARLMSWVIDAVSTHLPDVEVRAAGHRVVHGGTRFDGPAIIDATVIAEIERLAPLAPRHQPQCIAAIQTVAAIWPTMPQVACFDTAFHRRMPRLAQLYALPREFADAGVLRYGFHGLSYEYLAGRLPEIAGPRAGGRVILAHLGHGASLCAMRELRSVATSMGFSTLDGLMMGTRCGAIDPGVLLYLQQTEGLATPELSDLLYSRSGLLGVSALSDDLRLLEASGDPRAREAIELFVYSAVGEIGSMVAVLGGLDLLVFSAGIGEHSAMTRKRIAEQFGWLGLVLDDDANSAHESKISSTSSNVGVYIVPTDEEYVIACATRALAMQPPASG